MQIHSAISAMHYAPMRAVAAQSAPVPAPGDDQAGAEATAAEAEPGPAATKDGRPVSKASESAAADQQLTEDEQAQVDLLEKRDVEVRAHEQAHMAAGGQYVTGGPSYSYQLGPDGKRYAIGGEVGIDTAMSSGDPAANIEKARTLQRAALAPAEPSSQDTRVAAAARAMEIKAQQQLSELQQAQSQSMDSGLREGAGSESSDGDQVLQAGADEGGRGTSAQARLEQRIQSLFATPSEPRLYQVA